MNILDNPSEGLCFIFLCDGDLVFKLKLERCHAVTSKKQRHTQGDETYTLFVFEGEKTDKCAKDERDVKVKRGEGYGMEESEKTSRAIKNNSDIDEPLDEVHKNFDLQFNISILHN